MRAMRKASIGAALALLAGTFAVALPLATSAGASTFTVVNNHDSGTGSLRQALLDAAAHDGPDIVSVNPGVGTVTIATELLWDATGTGDQSVTIHGNGIVINMAGLGRGLVDDAGSGVTADNFTITGGTGSGVSDAGALVSEGGDVTISNCNITNNHLTSDDDVAGGVLSEGGDISVTGCKITGNVGHSTDDDATGGVLSEGGDVTLTNATITGNTGTADGGDGAGGINSEGGDVVVATSTISGNTSTAESDGAGGINSEGGDVTFRTVEANCNTVTATDGDAAGGLLSEGGDLTATSSNILGNRAKVNGDGTVENGINLNGGTQSLTSTNISDDQTVCQQQATTTTTTTAPSSTTTTAPAVAAVAATPAFTG